MTIETYSDMNRLIMQYLVIEGYKDAAEKFSKESGTDAGVDLSQISDRMSTRLYIQNGEIQKAIEKANDLNLQILDENPELFFHLQQQKLIEYIRAGKLEQALKFAQEELAPRGEENPKFLDELEKTMALLAFENTENCPVADLLQPAQRQKTASELNSAILTAQCQEKDPKLPALLKLLMWSQKQLKESVNFPTMDLQTGTLSSPPSALSKSDQS